MLAVLSITKKGNPIGEKLKENLDCKVFFRSEMENFKLKEVAEKLVKDFDTIVFISSTGIAVRAIDGLLNRKDIDPAILVVDVCNNFTISLVSGHLGGANMWTSKIAKILNNTPVITTATDNMNKTAPDVLAIENNLEIDSLKMAKEIAIKMVNEEPVYFKDDKNEIPLPKGYKETKDVVPSTVWITNSSKKELGVLKLIRRNIIIGIGCRRNTDSLKMEEFIFEVLEELNLSTKSIKVIGSIDLKKDEEAILNLANTLKTNTKFFTAKEISTVDFKYDGSDFVKKTTGVSCVSEPVIELLGGKIIRKKEKRDGMTLTIGIIE